MARVDRTCQVCQTVFQLPPSVVARERGIYCSVPCYRQAQHLGLGTRRTSRAQKYHWAPWMDALLHEHYDSQPATLAWLGTQLPFPRSAIHARVQRLGLARQKALPWTDAELEYVHTHLGHEAVPVMAKKLGRTAGAIKLMAKRRGINKHTNGGYTANSLLRLLGWQVQRVTALVERGWLEADRRQMAYGDKRPDAYLITDEALYRCLIAHPELIDLRRVDKDFFLDLVTHGAFTRARLKDVRHL